MSDERLRVFVSSKMQELKTEREVVGRVLEELNIKGWIFDKDAGARSKTIEQTFLEEVEKADLYIGLFWKGYGDYTVEEFEHAQALGTDCLIFQKQGEGIERQRHPALKEFLARINQVETGLTPAWFTSPEELAQLVRKGVTGWQTEIVRQRLDRQATRVFAGVPQGAPELIGRSGLIQELVHRLRTSRTSIALEGMPGVGKTALAAYVAQLPAILRAFKDGVLWGGLGPEADPGSVLAAWARALKLDLDKIRGENLRAEVAGAIGLRRMLLIIDDAWDAASAARLKAGGPNCCYLLTTRDRNVSREFAGAAGTVAIGVLSDSEAYQLLQTLAPEACEADDEGARRLACSMGGLPQGITLLGGYLAAPDNSVFADLSAEAMREMSDPNRRLQLAAERLGSRGEMTLESMIRLSLDRLAPATVDAFYALGAFVPKPEWFARSAAEFVTEAPLRALAQLAARNLIEVDASGSRVTLHQTISDVARRNVPSRATGRHQEFYLGVVNGDRYDRWTIADNYAQIKHAWQSLAEEPVLLDWLAALQPFHLLHQLDSERSEWAERALAMASRLGLRRQEGVLRANLAVLRYRLRRLDDAVSEGMRALALLDETNDRPVFGRALRNVGFFHLAQANNSQALEYLFRAVPVLRETNDWLALSSALTAIAAAHRAAGDEFQARLFEGQAQLTDRSSSEEQSAFYGEVELALEATFEQFMAEPGALVLLQAMVEKDRDPAGFDGSLAIAVHKEKSEEWRCWYAVFEASTAPRTEFSGILRDAGCVLLLSERDADALLLKGTVSAQATIHGDRRVLLKFVDRYLRGSPAERAPASPRQRAEQLHVIGSGLFQSGQPELAIENLTRAIGLWSDVVNSADASDQDSSKLCDSLRQRAKVYEKGGMLAEALADLDRAIEIEGPVSGGDPKCFAGAAASLSQRALLMASASRLTEAEDGWLRALALRQRAPDYERNDDLLGAQAGDHARRAMFVAADNRPAEASADFDHAIELYEQLVERGHDRFRKGLAIALQHGADAYRRAGQIEKALPAYDRVIELRDELEQKDVAELYKNRAFARVTGGQLRGAAADLDESVTRYTRLHEAGEASPGDLADTLFWRSYAHAATNAPDRALEDVSQAIEIYRSIDRAQPAASSAQNLVRSLRLRSELLGQLGKAGAAITDLDGALAVHEGAGDKADAAASLETLAEILTARASLLETQQRFGEAAADLQRVLSTYERLGGTPERASSDRIAETLNGLAWLMATCPEESIRDGPASVAFAQRACELSKWASYAYFDTLAASYAEAGDFERACEWQVKALQAANEEEMPAYQLRLKLYEQQKPFRDIRNKVAQA